MFLIFTSPLLTVTSKSAADNYQFINRQYLDPLPCLHTTSAWLQSLGLPLQVKETLFSVWCWPENWLKEGKLRDRKVCQVLATAFSRWHLKVVPHTVGEIGLSNSSYIFFIWFIVSVFGLLTSIWNGIGQRYLVFFKLKNR